MAPKTMKAIKIVGYGKAEIQDVPVPRLRDDYVLVKVKDVAINPTDWKHIHRESTAIPGVTSGCDFSGVVEEVGSKVTKEWKKGDRIAGFAHGGNRDQPEDGAFAEYAVVKGDVALKIPDNMTDEQAATVGIGVVTVGQGLYQTLQLPLPGHGKANIPILIYGGSTATGSLAIQYAVHSGCEVITTCSPHNFAFVKKLGAKEAFDYNDPECGKKIREYTQNRLTKALDCNAAGSSPRICCDAISSQGGVISHVLELKHDRTDVECKSTYASTYIGETFHKGEREYTASREDFEFAKRFWDLSAKLFASSQLSVHPQRVGTGGLEGVLDGIQQLKDGKVSGEKLVYAI